MKLTSKQYKETGASKCPFCGSDNIAADHFEPEVEARKVSCDDCGKRWWDIYELTGYENTKVTLL